MTFEPKLADETFITVNLSLFSFCQLVDTRVASITMVMLSPPTDVLHVDVLKVCIRSNVFPRFFAE